MARQFHVGLDLDNTIIDYDAAFVTVAAAIGLLPARHELRSKEAVRSYLRGLPDGERVWMRLQGQMYGRHIDHGLLCAGVPEFLRAVHGAGAKISIVSHKTRYGHFDESRVDLWEAALGWLKRRGLFTAEFGLQRANVHLRESREEKLATIGLIGCDVFIDDLPELLLHPNFPAATAPLWYAGAQQAAAGEGLTPHRDWRSLLAAVRRLQAAREQPTAG